MDGTATLTVELSESQPVTVSVEAATAYLTATGGADYEPLSAMVVFVPGETSVTLEVAILEYTDVEPDETFTVDLSNPEGRELAGPSSATVTIAGNDADPVIDTNLISLAQDGCTLILAAAPGAVTTVTGNDASVQLFVDNPSPADPWQTSWFDVASGEAFEVELTGAEPGNGGHDVRVWGFASAVAALLPAAPPTVIPEHISSLWDDSASSATVTVEPGALADRLGPVTLTLHNLTAGRSVWPIHAREVRPCRRPLPPPPPTSWRSKPATATRTRSAPFRRFRSERPRCDSSILTARPSPECGEPGPPCWSGPRPASPASSRSTTRGSPRSCPGSRRCRSVRRRWSRRLLGRLRRWL